jgi:hypothetical protein
MSLSMLESAGCHHTNVPSSRKIPAPAPYVPPGLRKR